jgi:hypothetical protein
MLRTDRCADSHISVPTHPRKSSPTLDASSQHFLCTNILSKSMFCRSSQSARKPVSEDGWRNLVNLAISKSVTLAVCRTEGLPLMCTAQHQQSLSLLWRRQRRRYSSCSQTAYLLASDSPVRAPTPNYAFLSYS